jgi:hypothetical protein
MPGNDSGSVSANGRWYYGDPCIIWNPYALNICYWAGRLRPDGATP